MLKLVLQIRLNGYCRTFQRHWNSSLPETKWKKMGPDYGILKQAPYSHGMPMCAECNIHPRSIYLIVKHSTRGDTRDPESICHSTWEVPGPQLNLTTSVSLSVFFSHRLSALFYSENVIFGVCLICVKGPLCQDSAFSGFTIYVYISVSSGCRVKYTQLTVRCESLCTSLLVWLWWTLLAMLTMLCFLMLYFFSKPQLVLLKTLIHPFLCPSELSSCGLCHKAGLLN